MSMISFFNLLEKVKVFHTNKGIMRLVEVLLNILIPNKSLRLNIIKDIYLRPDYPSLASLYNTFNKHGFSAVSVEIEASKEVLDKIPRPFLALVGEKRHKTGKFILVTECDVIKDRIEFYDENSQLWHRDSLDRYTNLLSGVVQYYPNNGINRLGIKERARLICAYTDDCKFEILLILFAIFMTLYQISWGAFFFTSYETAMLIVRTVLSLLGIYVSAHIIAKENGTDGRVLRNFCSANSKNSCAPILNGQGSHLLGYPLSIMSISYFLSDVLFSLKAIFSSNGEQMGSLLLISWIAILVIPYSLFYQYWIHKAWCKLCCCILGIIILQALCVLSISELVRLPTESTMYQCVIFLFLVSTITSRANERKTISENQILSREVSNFKVEPKVFFSLLSAMPQGQIANEGFIIGPTENKVRITSFCSPTCTPCRDVILELFKLAKECSSITIQLIYIKPSQKSNSSESFIKWCFNEYVTNKENFSNTIVKLYSDKDESYSITFGGIIFDPLQEADYSSFCRKMFSVAKSENIYITPTILINGYYVPTIYSLQEVMSLVKKTFR